MTASRLNILSRFWRDQSGATAMLFALTAIPALIAIGAAVDYGISLRVKADLDGAADSAAISAVNKDALALSKADAKKVATNTFNASSANITTSAVASVDIDVKETGNKRTATVTYSLQLPATFMGIFGYTKITLSGQATATSQMPAYIDFYVLLDNTPSMGVGATLNDISRLVANTSDQCAFACHDVSSNGSDYYALAKKLGVQLRIDTVRLATQNLMDRATSLRVMPNQYRMSIYTFGEKAEAAGLKKIQSRTQDLAKAKSSASAIDLMTIPYSNYNGDTQTDFGKVFASLNSEIDEPGDGSNPGKAMKYVFLVSDGVANRVAGSTACTKNTVNAGDPRTGVSYTRCQEPLNPAMCTALKNRGVKIAVLYTTYLPLPTNNWYNTYIGPWQNDIGGKMRECASTGLYFEVSPSQGISEAMNALFEKLVAMARLSN